MLVYDIETFNTIERVPYSKRIYRLSKISGKNNRDITEKNMKNVEILCIVFEELEEFNKC